MTRRMRLRAHLDWWGEKTRAESPFYEVNLTFAQKACYRFCRGYSGKCTTEIDLRRKIATVTADAKTLNPMRNWEFLGSVEPHVWRIIPNPRIFSEVAFWVKFFE